MSIVYEPKSKQCDKEVKKHRIYTIVKEKCEHHVFKEKFIWF
jgi:hypothetical protein